MKVIQSLLLVFLSFPIFAQSIPSIFWDAPLGDSRAFIGGGVDLPVKAVFRDQKFKRLSETQLDGTIATSTSRMTSTKIKGNDVFISIDTLSSNKVIMSVIWQLRYQLTVDSSSYYVGIETVEVVNPATGESQKMDIEDVKDDGDGYKQYLMTIARLMAMYYDTNEIVQKYAPAAPSDQTN